MLSNVMNKGAKRVGLLSFILVFTKIDDELVQNVSFPPVFTFLNDFDSQGHPDALRSVYQIRTGR